MVVSGLWFMIVVVSGGVWCVVGVSHLTFGTLCSLQQSTRDGQPHQSSRQEFQGELSHNLMLLDSVRVCAPVVGTVVQYNLKKLNLFSFFACTCRNVSFSE